MTTTTILPPLHGEGGAKRRVGLLAAFPTRLLASLESTLPIKGREV
jgi:hypothetical protein